MKRSFWLCAGLLLGFGPAGAALAQQPQAQGGAGMGGWKVHSMERPRPPVITPAPASDPVPPPPGAVVLFDGDDLSHWTTPGGGAAGWKVENGYFEVVPGSGPIRTRAGFGDVHLHVEWASPEPPRGTGQGRGNSGVFLMGLYEVQVLDSYRNDTYADGQAAAVYGQYPPRLNASRPPGEWQTYDIFFRRPRFGPDGSLREPARVTVLHNGILVQNNEELPGRGAWLRHIGYQAHADQLPVELQDHGDPVRFRNLWAVPVPELPEPDPAREAERFITLPAAVLDRYAGRFSRDSGDTITLRREGDRLLAEFSGRPGPLELRPVSPTELVLTETDGRIVLELDQSGTPSGLVFHLGGARMPARRVR